MSYFDILRTFLTLLRAREYLNRSIQTGGATEGHSSAEDALASLDLVKYYIKDRKGRLRVTSGLGDW